MTATASIYLKEIESYGRKDSDESLRDVRLLYADWLDEQGEDLLAGCQRWLAKNNRRAWEVVGCGGLWTWCDLRDQDIRHSPYHSALPSRVYRRLSSIYCGSYRSPEAAEMALARALRKEGLT